MEVKAGTSGSQRSLHQFFAREMKTSTPLALRFDLNPPSLSDHVHQVPSGKEVRYRLLSLPLYLVGQWERLVTLVLRDAPR